MNQEQICCDKEKLKLLIEQAVEQVFSQLCAPVGNKDSSKNTLPDGYIGADVVAEMFKVSVESVRKRAKDGNYPSFVKYQKLPSGPRGKWVFEEESTRQLFRKCPDFFSLTVVEWQKRIITPPFFAPSPVNIIPMGARS